MLREFYIQQEQLVAGYRGARSRTLSDEFEAARAPGYNGMGAVIV